MEINFCGNNQGAGRICRELQGEFPGQRFKVKNCLKNCALCNMAPFALVDGVRVTSGSWPELRQKLQDIIVKG